MHLMASHHRRGSVGRHALALRMCLVCAGAGLLGCSGRSEPEKAGAPDLTEAEEGAEGPSFAVLLQRLGAPDGGAWKAPIKGGRILMWLSKNYVEDDDAYVAVLRTGERPLAFGIFELHVGIKGNVAMSLVRIGKDEDDSILAVDDSPPTYVLGIAQGDVIRINETVDDQEALFPSGTELRRCSKLEETEVRKTVHESIK